MENSIQQYVTAYRKGLLDAQSPLFSEIQELVALYDNIDNLYDDLVQIRNSRNDDGSYVNNYELEDEYLSIINNSEQLASSLSNEIAILIKNK